MIHELLGPLVERPPYAQIIAWTCEDHPDDVVQELLHALTTTARGPAAAALASESVPITVRFQPGERLASDNVIMQAGGKAAKITRTAAVIAAFRVAIKQGLPITAARTP